MTRDMEVVFIADKTLRELECLFACDIDDDDFYDVVAYNISQLDPDYLLRHMDQYAGPRLRGAVFGLGLIPTRNRAQEGRLVALLEHTEPLVVAEAIAALKNSDHKEYWSVIASMSRHEAPVVRGAVLRYASHALTPDQAYSFLVAGLDDPDSTVRASAIDELGDLGDKEAVTRIRPLLRDSDEDVQQAARTAINGLLRLRT
jgi:HEAT repeat protein